MLKGVDISGYQSAEFDFSAYDFGIIKATEGSGPLNSKFNSQVQSCLNAGKGLGFYHFARPEYNDFQTEARAFLERVSPYLGKAVLCLDWEDKATGYPVSWALNWLNFVHNETGIRPFFYSYSNYIVNTDLSSIASKYPLWLAQYTSGTPNWKWWNKWKIWQYTDSPVDTNWFDGTRLQWEEMGGKIKGNWISKNQALKNSEMENNAELVWDYFRGKGWTLESVCGMLGNMEKESWINPGVWGYFNAWGNPDSTGLGLVQFTPYTKYTEWGKSHGYAFDSGEGQCAKIQEQMEQNEWVTSGTPYNLTFREYSRSNASPDQLAMIFLACYERPLEPNQPERGKRALAWFSYLRGAPIFVPRLNDNGMKNNPFWYKNNPFYQAGYGLPNCTCYVWGRWWEITGIRPDKLSVGNGRDFYPEGAASGIPHGQTPQLGAIACWEYVPGGHVAVVEQINSDGSIIISESGWGSWYFKTETLYPPDYTPSWVKTIYGGYLQGFLYLDTQPTPPDPEIPPDGDDAASSIIYYLKKL